MTRTRTASRARPLLLAATLCLVLVACGRGPNPAPNPDVPPADDVAGTIFVDEQGRSWTALERSRSDEAPTAEELGTLPEKGLLVEGDTAPPDLETLAENLRPIMHRDGIAWILSEPDLELARTTLESWDEPRVQPGPLDPPPATAAAAELAELTLSPLTDGAVADLADVLLPRKVIGSDGRSLRLNNTQAPWRSHVYISSNQGNCSGTMIGPRTILTSAHCVRSGSGAVKSGLTFRPGVDGGDSNWAPYGRYRWDVDGEVCALWWPAKYTSSSPVRYDYAVARLCDNPGVNWWHGYGSFSGSTLQGLSVWLFGYPAEDIPAYVDYPQIFGMGCSIKERYTRSVHYRCDATGGQSGTGVYHIFGEWGRVIVGVHKGSWGNYRNRATRITSEVFSFIQTYGF